MKALDPETVKVRDVSRPVAAIQSIDWDAVTATGKVDHAVKDEARRQATVKLLADLLDDVFRYFTRYVHFTNAAHPVAVTLWTVYTHCFGAGQDYSWVPYLLVTSAEPSSGKTTLMDLTAKLAFEPLRAESMTPAYVGRAAGGKTLLLDEVDGIYKGTKTDSEGSAVDLRTILNGGFNKSGTYARLVQTKGGAYEEKQWPTFGPKFLAGIGRNVPETVKSRSIRVRLERKPRGVEVERARDRFVNAIAEPLRTRIVGVTKDLGTLPFVDVLPDGMGDRDQDIWEPLIALADQAGGNWPIMAREAAKALCKSELSLSNGQQLLKDIRDLFEAEGCPTFMSTSDIIGRPESPDPNFGHDASGLCAVEDFGWAVWSRGKPITAHAMAKLLGEYDISSSRETLGGHSYGPSGYFRASFEQAWDRYLADSSNSAEES